MISSHAFGSQLLRRDGKRKPHEWSAPAPYNSQAQLDRGMTTFLGCFSIGLGLAQMIAPRHVARLVGLQEDDFHCKVMRACGLRELSCGVGILASSRPTRWVQARVAGDAMDLAMLSGAAAMGAPNPERVAAASAAVLGVTALDAYTSIRLSQTPDARRQTRWSGPIGVRKAITVNRSADELYQFWRPLENLPRFMSHLESVQNTGGNRSHWKAKAPAGMSVEWDAEIVEDQPHSLIAWRSLDGADVCNTGSVRFVPVPGDNRGTEVRVVLHYHPPGGRLGAWFATLFGEAPEQQLLEDLRLFKQVMETGEVVLSDSSFSPTPASRGQA